MVTRRVSLRALQESIEKPCAHSLVQRLYADLKGLASSLAGLDTKVAEDLERKPGRRWHQPSAFWTSLAVSEKNQSELPPR